jgi:DNA-binding transcriptional MocR family regulator
MDTRRRIDAPELVRLLGRWAADEGPLFRALARSLTRLIQMGELEPELVLPAERELAQRLLVSRSTVMQAYEVLKSESWLASRQGSGTWVSERPPGNGSHSAASRPPPAAAAADSTLFAALAHGATVQVDLTVAAMPALDLVWRAYREVTDAELTELGKTVGYEPAGLPQLREALATHFTRSGLPTTEDEVLVTNGTAQALTLIAHSYLRTGDRVLTEDPTCPVALAAFRQARASLVPIAAGEHGPDPEAVASAVRQTHPQLVYLSPGFHNPCGHVMSSKRRAELAGLAARWQVPVVEDLTNADLVLERAAPPPIASFEQRAPVISVGSFSKLFWAGLRVGWVRAAAPVIARLARIKSVADLGSSLPAQLHGSRLIASIDEARMERRCQLVERLDCLTAELTTQLPEWRWTRPAGGLSLWVRLPNTSGLSFAQAALYQGVAIVPGAVFSVTQAHDSYIRLTFGQDPAVLTDAVRRLSRAWAGVQPHELTPRPAWFATR